MLQRKQQFRVKGTLFATEAEKDKALMAKMHEQDLANIQQKKNEEGDARTESGGPISEGDYEKDNPKEVQTAAMVVNAELRRDQWIRHQVEEYKSQPELDCVFRKGVDRGVNVNHHNYRI